MDLNLRGKLAPRHRRVQGNWPGVWPGKLAEEGCHLHLASRTKRRTSNAPRSRSQARYNVSVTVPSPSISATATPCGSLAAGLPPTSTSW